MFVVKYDIKQKDGTETKKKKVAERKRNPNSQTEVSRPS